MVESTSIAGSRAGWRDYLEISKPRVVLLMLVCAFAGMDEMLEAYRHAVEQQYRFFSYGDAMLVL